jgi:hypothetical protein
VSIRDAERKLASRCQCSRLARQDVNTGIAMDAVMDAGMSLASSARKRPEDVRLRSVKPRSHECGCIIIVDEGMERRVRFVERDSAMRERMDIGSTNRKAHSR